MASCPKVLLLSAALISAQLVSGCTLDQSDDLGCTSLETNDGCYYWTSATVSYSNWLILHSPYCDDGMTAALLYGKIYTTDASPSPVNVSISQFQGEASGYTQLGFYNSQLSPSSSCLQAPQLSWTQSSTYSSCSYNGQSTGCDNQAQPGIMVTARPGTSPAQSTNIVYGAHFTCIPTGTVPARYCTPGKGSCQTTPPVAPSQVYNVNNILVSCADGSVPQPVTSIFYSQNPGGPIHYYCNGVYPSAAPTSTIPTTTPVTNTNTGASVAAGAVNLMTWSNGKCSGAPASSVQFNAGQCQNQSMWQYSDGLTTAGYVQVHCDSSSQSSAWTVSLYDSSNGGCTTTNAATTVSGHGLQCINSGTELGAIAIDCSGVDTTYATSGSVASLGVAGPHWSAGSGHLESCSTCILEALTPHGLASTSRAEQQSSMACSVFISSCTMDIIVHV